ncbi:MAG: hypothetical protein VKI42_02980 [Synechococcaceae cyanobacterium]|nr:hypothetical protein [Synechococcaceae cyanobacterium]
MTLFASILGMAFGLHQQRQRRKANAKEAPGLIKEAWIGTNWGLDRAASGSRTSSGCGTRSGEPPQQQVLPQLV